MSLSEPRAKREPLHRRTIEIVGYKREDGLFDIEGRLLDRKDVAFPVGGRGCAAGRGGPRHVAAHHRRPRAAHRRRRRLDRRHALRRATATASRRTTAKLIGLSIGPGYLRHVKELLGGVRGCTHITELAGSLATAAFQTFAGQGLAPPERKPPQLDRCHALDSHGPTVARFYPKWYRGTAPAADAGPTENH